MKFVVENEGDLVKKTWECLVAAMRPGFVVGLRGDLGAGKTTLVKGTARLLGVKDIVSSPTFNIAKRYKTSDKNLPILQHIDLYRLSGANSEEEEIIDMISDANTITFVEWPDNINGLAKRLGALVEIVPNDDGSRTVTIKISGNEN